LKLTSIKEDLTLVCITLVMWYINWVWGSAAIDLPGPSRVLKGWDADSVLALKENQSASLQIWRWIRMRPTITSHLPMGDVLYCYIFNYIIKFFSCILQISLAIQEAIDVPIARFAHWFSNLKGC
jgi:hypothetical protein